MSDTIFHKILRKDIPAECVFEDADAIAIRDIHPKAPTHLLFIPKQFVASIIDAHGALAGIPGMLIQKAREFAQEKGIDGYRLQFNVGSGGGQEVMYLHLHFLSERKW